MRGWFNAIGSLQRTVFGTATMDGITELKAQSDADIQKVSFSHKKVIQGIDKISKTMNYTLETMSLIVKHFESDTKQLKSLHYHS